MEMESEFITHQSRCGTGSDESHSGHKVLTKSLFSFPFLRREGPRELDQHIFSRKVLPYFPKVIVVLVQNPAQGNLAG